MDGKIANGHTCTGSHFILLYAGCVVLWVRLGNALNCTVCLENKVVLTNGID